jgi:hypothetical protein
MEGIGNLPPYRWLFSGHSLATVRRDARVHTEMFPRVLMTFRLLGGFVLAVAGVIVATVVVQLMIHA